MDLAARVGPRVSLPLIQICQVSHDSAPAMSLAVLLRHTALGEVIMEAFDNSPEQRTVDSDGLTPPPFATAQSGPAPISSPVS